MYSILYDEIKVENVSGGKIVTYPFNVDDINYKCSIVELSCELPDISDIKADLIENEGFENAGQNTFWVDFDSVENIRAKTNYLEQKGSGGFKGLIHLTEALREIIGIHEDSYKCEFFFAEPASVRLSKLYKRLLIPKLEKDGYNYYTEDDNGDGWYVFQKD